MSGFLANKSLLSPTVTRYSGGTASFTLPQSGSTNSTQVLVGGVEQVPGVDFTVSGTALTLTTSAPAGSNMVCARQYFADGIVNTPADNSVATAKIQDNAINLAKMAGGTDGQIITYDASGDPVAVGPGTDGQVLTSTGAGAPPAFEAVSAGFTQGTEIATTSGTAITFGSIPAGVSMVIMNLVGVSQNTNTKTALITLGDAGGLETSGYLGCSAKIQDTNVESTSIRHTAGFGIGTVNYDSGDLLHGQFTFCLEDASAFTWTYTGFVSDSAEDGVWFGTGSKSLSAELTQISFAAGGATFDAGAMNIMYQ